MLEPQFPCIELRAIHTSKNLAMSHVSSGNDSNQATKIEPRSCWEVAPIIASQQDDDVSPGITAGKAQQVLRVATLVLEDTFEYL